jgi:D-alanyl-D-alanine carboxypeptidase/D-alanyl-D-alanine-endopeptidase (penicillin-binding protein 4)
MPNKPTAFAAALALAASLVVTLGVASPVQPAAAAATCSAKTQLANPLLGKFYGYVMDTKTRKVLLDIRGKLQTPSASVLKLLTGASALFFLSEDYRAETSIYQVASDPSTIYFVGGGDHTLSAYMPPSYTTYKNPPRLARLAAKVLTKIGAETKIKKIVFDTSFFDENGFNPFWLPTDRTSGFVSHISALMADADRASSDLTKANYSSWRSEDPAKRAAGLLRTALGEQAKNARLVRGLKPEEATSITSVKSQPLSVWIEHAMHISDNTETEIIARHIQKMLVMPTTFKSVQPVTELMLGGLDINPKGLIMRDASGLAQANRVTPKIIAELLTEAAQPNSPIQALPALLPTPSSYGTLTGRFKGDNAVVRKSVSAKSGYIPGLSSLAGLVTAKDGSKLAFAFFARTQGDLKIGYGTKTAVDSLVARAYVCGAKLTRN